MKQERWVKEKLILSDNKEEGSLVLVFFGWEVLEPSWSWFSGEKKGCEKRPANESKFLMIN